MLPKVFRLRMAPLLLPEVYRSLPINETFISVLFFVQEFDSNHCCWSCSYRFSPIFLRMLGVLRFRKHRKGRWVIQ